MTRPFAKDPEVAVYTYYHFLHKRLKTAYKIKRKLGYCFVTHCDENHEDTDE